MQRQQLLCWRTARTFKTCGAIAAGSDNPGFGSGGIDQTAVNITQFKPHLALTVIPIDRIGSSMVCKVQYTDVNEGHGEKTPFAGCQAAYAAVV